MSAEAPLLTHDGGQGHVIVRSALAADLRCTHDAAVVDLGTGGILVLVHEVLGQVLGHEAGALWDR